MKPATDTPDASQVRETVTRTRIVPVDSVTEQRTPECWEYLRSVRENDWGNHMLYLYRDEPSPRIPVQKFQQYMTMPNGQQVSVTDQDEFEFALLQHFGGKHYRLMVKRKSQLITTGRISIDAPAKQIIPVDVSGPGAPTIPTGQTSEGSDLARVANRAIDTVASQEHQAVRIGMEALNSAAHVVQSFAADNRRGGGDTMDRIVAMALERLLNPPDPVAQFVAMMTAMRQFAPESSGARDPISAKILEAGVERILNPPPSGAPVSANAEFVRAIPQIGGTVVEGIREYRMSLEAQERLMSMGAKPQMQPAAPHPNQTVLSAASSRPADATGAPSMEFIEKRIIEFLQDPKFSATDAADAALAFLDGLNPDITAELAKLKEEGLVATFQSRPILAQATNNMPRLVEFVRAFLRLHAEDVAPQNGHEDAAVKPTLPN